MKKYGVRVFGLYTDSVRHITGEWEGLEAMQDDLMKDGYIILSCWEE